MTKRLQIVLDDVELLDLERLARRRGMTTAEWVRRSIRAALDAESGAGSIAEKLAAVRAASAFTFPTADVDPMLDEIERG